MEAIFLSSITVRFLFIKKGMISKDQPGPIFPFLCRFTVRIGEITYY